MRGVAREFGGVGHVGSVMMWCSLLLRFAGLIAFAGGVAGDEGVISSGMAGRNGEARGRRSREYCLKGPGSGDSRKKLGGCWTGWRDLRGNDVRGIIQGNAVG